MKDTLNQMVTDVKEYVGRDLGTGHRETFQGARAAQIACFLMFNHSKSPDLNKDAKLVLARVVAATIDGTNTRWWTGGRSQLRKILNPSKEPLKLAAIPNEFKNLQSILSIDKGSETLLVLVAVLKNLLCSTELTLPQKKAAIDAWVMAVSNLTSDNHPSELRILLEKVKTCAGLISRQVITSCMKAQFYGSEHSINKARLLGNCRDALPEIQAINAKLDKLQDYYGLKSRVLKNYQILSEGLESLEAKLRSEQPNLTDIENGLNHLIGGGFSALVVMRTAVKAIELLKKTIDGLMETKNSLLAELKNLKGININKKNGFLQQRLESLEASLKEIDDKFSQSIFNDNNPFNHNEDFKAINDKNTEIDRLLRQCSAEIESIKNYGQLNLSIPLTSANLRGELTDEEFVRLPDYHGFKNMLLPMLEEITEKNAKLSQGMRPTGESKEHINFFEELVALDAAVKVIKDGVEAIKASAVVEKEIATETHELGFLIADEKSSVVYVGQKQRPEASKARNADLQKVAGIIAKNQERLTQSVVSKPVGQEAKPALTRAVVTAAQQKNSSIKSELETARQVMVKVKSADGYFVKIRKGLAAFAERVKNYFGFEQPKSKPDQFTGPIVVSASAEKTKFEMYYHEQGMELRKNQEPWMTEELKDLVENPLFKAPGRGDVKKNKDLYKVHAYYLIRRKLDNLQRSVAIYSDRQAPGKNFLPQELSRVAKDLDNVYANIAELEKLIAGVRENYDFTNSKSKNLVPYSSNFSPLLDQLESELSDVRKQIFGFDLSAKMSDEEKVYYNKGIEFHLLESSLDELKSVCVQDVSPKSSMETYQACAYVYLRKQLSNLSRLVEEIKIIKDKIKIKGESPNYDLKPLSTKSAELAKIHADLSLILEKAKKNSSSDPRFLGVINKIAGEFGKFTGLTYYEVFQHAVNQAISKSELPSLTDVAQRRELHALLIKSPLAIEKEKYPVYAFYMLKHSLNELSDQSQRISQLEEDLYQKGKLLTREDVADLINKIDLLKASCSSFKDLLRIMSDRKDLLPHSFEFGSMLNHFSTEINGFNQVQLPEITAKRDKLEGFLDDLEKQRIEIATSLRSLAQENSARSQEAVAEIISQDPLLEGMAKQAADVTQPLPGQDEEDDVVEEKTAAPSLVVSPKVEVEDEEEEEEKELPLPKKELTDEEAYKLLVEKDAEARADAKSGESPSLRVSSFDTAQNVVTDIFKCLDAKNCDGLITFDASTEAMRQSWRKGEHFVISPKAFIYGGRQEVLQALREGQGMSSASETASLTRAFRFLLVAVRSASALQNEFLNGLQDDTVMWIAKNVNTVLFPKERFRSQDEEARITRILSNVEVRQSELLKNKVKMEVTSLVGNIIDNMINSGGSDSLWESLSTSDKTREQRRKIIVDFCGGENGIFRIEKDSKGEEQVVIKPGVSAHRIMEWVENTALKWKEEKRVTDPVMLKFSEQLGASKRNGKILSPEAEAEYSQSEDVRGLNRAIREDLTVLFHDSEENKEKLLQAAELICSSKGLSEKDRIHFKQQLEKVEFTKEKFNQCRHGSSSSDILDFINTMLKILCKDQVVRKILLGKQASFAGYRVGDDKSFGLNYTGNPPQLHFENPKHNPYVEKSEKEIKKVDPKRQAANQLPETKELKDSELSGVKLQVQEQLSRDMIPQDIIKRNEKEIKERHAQVQELAKEAEVVLGLVERLQTLVKSQDEGTSGYDVVLLSVSSDEKDVVGQAKNASRRVEENKACPVLIRQGEKIYVYGNSTRGKKWDGDSLVLTSVETNQLNGNSLKELQSTRIPIINKNARGECSSLKFNGASWDVTNLSSKEVAELKTMKFPEVGNVEKMDSCSLSEELIKKLGAHKNWRLTEVGSYSDSHRLVQELVFPKMGSPELREGQDIDPKVYQKITQVGGHQAPCIAMVVVNIESARGHSQAGSENLESAESAKVVGEVLQEDFDMLKSLATEGAKHLAPAAAAVAAKLVLGK